MVDWLLIKVLTITVYILIQAVAFYFYNNQAAYSSINIGPWAIRCAAYFNFPKTKIDGLILLITLPGLLFSQTVWYLFARYLPS